jgi:hypothetical protein
MEILNNPTDHHHQASQPIYVNSEDILNNDNDPESEKVKNLERLGMMDETDNNTRVDRVVNGDSLNKKPLLPKRKHWDLTLYVNCPDV